MKKTIFITGSTDGIGLATAKQLVSQNHDVIIHGRNIEKLIDALDSEKVSQVIKGIKEILIQQKL